METDKRYFIEGLFIIGFAVAAALFAVWLANSGDSDDVTLPDSFRGIRERARRSATRSSSAASTSAR